MTIWTCGHSNTPVEPLLDLLLSANIELLIDVRRFPMSRRNPQFNRDRLAASLAEHGIEYLHAPELGGRRDPRPDSTNAALTNEGFRGYADYMETPEFEAALDTLVEQSQAKRTTVMCAESLPWRCHRSLIADALVASGIEVEHLMHAKPRTHTLTPAARVIEGRVGYPALL